MDQPTTPWDIEDPSFLVFFHDDKVAMIVPKKELIVDSKERLPEVKVTYKTQEIDDGGNDVIVNRQWPGRIIFSKGI